MRFSAIGASLGCCRSLIKVVHKFEAGTAARLNEVVRARAFPLFQAGLTFPVTRAHNPAHARTLFGRI
jgi:hypothetical protein